MIASVGCAAEDYYVLYEGKVCSYNPSSRGDDSVTFADGRTFNTSAIMAWDKCLLEFKRNSWVISDNVIYSLIHKTDGTFLLIPSNMIGDAFNHKIKSKDGGCK